MSFVELTILSVVAMGVIALTFVKPRMVLMVYMFALLAFNDYIGGLPSSVIRIGGRLFYAADFFLILLSAGLIRALFHKDLISRIDRPVLTAMVIFSLYGLAGMLIGADHRYLYNNIIGDFRRYFYYPWAILIPILVLRDRHDIKIIEKAAFVAALIICLFASYRMITGQTFFPEVHGNRFDLFRAMGYHDYMILVFVVCLAIGKILIIPKGRNIIPKACLLLLPPFIIASNYRVAWAFLVICPVIMVLLIRSRGISLRPLAKGLVLSSVLIVLLGATGKISQNETICSYINAR